MKYGPLALGMLLTTALGSPAAAQVTANSMVQGRQARVLELNAQAQVEHDTNISRTNAALAAQRNLSLEDTVFTPSASVNFVQPLGRQAVFLRGTVGYNFHDRNKKLDHERFDVGGGLGGNLGPCGSVLGAGYLQGRGELADAALDTNVQNVQEVKRVSVDLACSRPTGLGIVASGSRAWADNSLPQVAASDSETTKASAGISYQRPSTGSLTLFTDYSRTEYPHRPTLGPGVNGFETRSVGLTASRQLGGRIQVTLSGGYTEVDSLDPPLTPSASTPGRNFSGATYSGDLTFRVSSRLHAQLLAARSVEPTLITSGSYQVQTDYNASADYAFGSRILVTVGARQRDVNIDGLGVATIGPTLTDSRTRSGFASVRFKQNERLSFILRGLTEDRNSDNPQFEYTNNVVSLSAAVSF